MKKLLFSAIIALLPLSAMSATILGFQIGGGNWDQTPSGTLISTVGSDTIKETEKGEGYTYLVFEHPVPLIPNVKLANTKVSAEGNSVITSLEVDQTDATLYYEILDNVVSLDIGVTARKVDGQLTGAGSATFSGTVPLLYAAAEIMLPSGFALAAEINTIGSGNDKISDISAKVTYTTSVGLGIEVGTRTQNFEVDIDSVQTDIEFSGIFAGVYFKF